jgi:hypothetical protein
MLQNVVNKTEHNANGDEKQTTVNKTKERQTSTSSSHKKAPLKTSWRRFKFWFFVLFTTASYNIIQS